MKNNLKIIRYFVAISVFVWILFSVFINPAVAHASPDNDPSHYLSVCGGFPDHICTYSYSAPANYYINFLTANIDDRGGGSSGEACVSGTPGTNCVGVSGYGTFIVPGGIGYDSAQMIIHGLTVPGSGAGITADIICQLSCNPSPSPGSSHYGCINNACVLDAQFGDKNLCDVAKGNVDCTPVVNHGGPGRFECSDNSCKWAVDHLGPDQCGTNSDCIAAAPPVGGGPSHFVCQNYTCVNVSGAGADLCDITPGSCGAPTPIASIDCQTITSGYVYGGPCTAQSGEEYTIFGTCTYGDQAKDYTIRNDTGQTWPIGVPFFGSAVTKSPATYTTYCYYDYNLFPTEPISATLQVFPPSLSATLTATPNSGASPLDVTLRADAGGTALGTINYSFWWNCINDTTSIATATTACGALPAPGPNFCASNANGLKCNAMNVTTYTPVDVIWQNPKGVIVSDNNLTKNLGNNSWDDSGASSNRGFSGDGYMEFTASETDTNRFIGLSNDVTHKYTKIDYAIYLAADNQLYVVENGESKLLWTPGDINTWYTTNNVLRIAVVSGQVQYYKNNVLIYSSLIAPTYPLFVDTSFNTNTATVWNVKINPVPSHTYIASSTAKVIIERGALSAQAQAAIGVIGPPPTISAVTETDPDYCVSGPAATIGWTYSDPAGNPQDSYQVQITDTGSFISPLLDTGKVNSGSNSYFTGQGVLQLNTTYKARIRAWNSFDAVSEWAVSSSWKTPSSAYPQVDFYWTANGIQNNPSPPLNKPVVFTDQTVFSGGGSNNWSWAFGDSGTSTLQNPSHTYTEGTYLVTLTATDNNKQSCSRTKGPITIQKPIPKWREIAPK